MEVSVTKDANNCHYKQHEDEEEDSLAASLCCPEDAAPNNSCPDDEDGNRNGVNQQTNAVVPEPLPCIAKESLRPIACILEETVASCHGVMFRVLRSKGKALTSGGFGVVLPPPTTLSNTKSNTISSSKSCEQLPADKGSTSVETSLIALFNGDKKSRDYLFLEEVLYLHERGFIHVYQSNFRAERQKPVIERNQHQDKSSVLREMDSWELYKLLCCSTLSSSAVKPESIPEQFITSSLLPDPLELIQLNNQTQCNNGVQNMTLLSQSSLSLPIYLVYAHLRQQDFRVMRHSQAKQRILEKMRDQNSNKERQQQQQSKSFKITLRRAAAEAPPPQICDRGALASPPSLLAWDVYQPSSRFSRSAPGLPDFYVAVTYYTSGSIVAPGDGGPINQHHLCFQDLRALLEQCRGIPLKVAAVSDSGTVVMYGVAADGVPCIN